MKRLQKVDRERVRKGRLMSVGHFGAYYAYRMGMDDKKIRYHAVVDDASASSYVTGLRSCLYINGYQDIHGNILDVGCGMGSITNALNNLNTNGVSVGIDISEDAIAVATDRYPNCKFYCQSAENLRKFKDEYFDVIHAREFYPFTRTNDIKYELKFLKVFFRKLKPGGLVIVADATNKKGLCNNYLLCAGSLKKEGCTSIKKVDMLPLKFSALLGNLQKNKAIYLLSAYFARLIFATKLDIFQGRSSGFFYTLKKQI